MTKRIILSLFTCATCLTIASLFSSSTYLPFDRSAGVASTNCGGCHAPGSTDAGGDFSITGIPAEYTPSQTYPASICITDPSKSAGGFSMYQDNGGGSFASNVFAPSDGTSYYRPGNTYLTHSNPKNLNAVTNTACWDFTWTAPASGTVTIGAAGNAVDQMNGSSGDNGGYTTMLMTSAQPFPVDLVDFSVFEKDKQVVLQWQTAQEVDNDYFEIQRSVNARDWQVLGQQAGAGHSTERTDYEFVDESPIENRTLYYRLKQVDFDGSVEFSLIKKIAVQVPFVTIEKIFPNPVAQSEDINLNFNLTQNLAEVEVHVFDILGHLHLQQKVQPNTGLNKISVASNKLIAGQYFISIVADSQRVMSDVFVVVK